MYTNTNMHGHDNNFEVKGGKEQELKQLFAAELFCIHKNIRKWGRRLIKIGVQLLLTHPFFFSQNKERKKANPQSKRQKKERGSVVAGIYVKGEER